MKHLKPFRWLFVLITLGAFSFIQADELDLSQELPIDPNVAIGEFDNGLRYYIRVNEKPENRAIVRLVVNAGAVLEDDDQDGFAHLGEHMAFNGTKNFEKQELVDYLESIGMKFGPEVNAGTGYDYVHYILQLPTDSLHQFEKGFQVLEDWAHQVTYDDEEIQKERGVVIEEWRLYRGATARMEDKWFPILFQGSKYAERNIIGDIELLKNDDNDAVRRFYKDWYRPDLFAVIAIGDFDADYVKTLIESHFASIPMPEDPRAREYYPVPDHQETLYAIVTDPEAPRTDVQILFKRDVKKITTIGDYRHSLVERLYNQMQNIRLNELRQQADPPFMYGFASTIKFIQTKDLYYMVAGVKEDGIERGIETLFTEALRVKRHGFLASELDRARAAILRMYEQAYNERDKTESIAYADEYLRNFIYDETIPGIENEYHYAKTMLPGISLQEVNGLVDDFVTDSNRVVIVRAPEKDGFEIPTEQDLKTILASIENKDIQPYEDNVSDEPLVADPPKPGAIVKERKIDELDVVEWTLDNNIRIMLKPTDFKNDEIQFQGGRWGGHSLASDSEYLSASHASSIINQSGWGQFDPITLQKKLTGKIARVYTNISESMETVSGRCSPKDVETFFQLVYLSFTAPRMDTEAFESYKARMKGYLENEKASPEAVFSDTIQTVIHLNHPRRLPEEMEDYDNIDLQAAYSFYKDRFSDVGDFYFVIVGNFDVEEIKPLVLRYLGGLPARDREHSNKDPQVELFSGRVEKTVKKGIEPKARVQIELNGDYDWSLENNYAFYSMRDVLDIKLREVIREEKSGTYGVRVSAMNWFTPNEKYRISIGWGCDPERVDELTETMYSVIDSVKNFGPDDLTLKKVREQQLRSHEVNLKENGWWNDRLGNAYWADYNHVEILKVPERAATLSKEMIQEATKTYFNTENVARFVLLPESE